MLALFVQPFTGAMAVPGPFLIAAALGAGLLLVWYVNLRDTAGFSRAASLACVALLALNPFFLRAVAEGGEALLTLLGTWVFARGIVNLRLTGNAPDMMKVAVGMLVVSLSSSYGLMICLGSLPFMIVAGAAEHAAGLADRLPVCHVLPDRRRHRLADGGGGDL